MTLNSTHPPSTTRVGTPLATAPAGPASRRFVITLTIAQFGLFVALLGPVMVSLALKARQLRPDDSAAVLGGVMALAAFGALVANPVFGMLSDRTRSRFGRRRPWILGGLVVFTAALVGVAAATSVAQLTVFWLLAQIGANATLACLTATVADQVPAQGRGRVSGYVGIAQNVAVLLATFIAQFFVIDMLPLFLVPAAISLVAVVVFAVLLKDTPHPERRPAFDVRAFVATFWTNPLRFPDFALAWWSRFFIILGSFLFTTFRLTYMVDHLGLSAQSATSAVFVGVVVYTAGLVAAAWLGGRISDRLGRRKVLVAASTALFALGLVVLAHADTVGVFYVAEFVMGVAYGAYVAVDTALVIDVLPSAETVGKDLGVMNIANAAPQSLAPAMGVALLGVGGGAATNYPVLLWGAGALTLVGALVIMFVRSVR